MQKEAEKPTKSTQSQRKETINKIEIWKGFFTEVEVDCIVNIINPKMKKGGIICQAVHTASKADILETLRTVKEKNIGDAFVIEPFEIRQSSGLYFIVDVCMYYYMNLLNLQKSFMSLDQTRLLNWKKRIII